MRQIITQSSWRESSSGNVSALGSQREDQMRLNVMEDHSSRGETDSSFEVPGANTNYGGRHMYLKSAPTKLFNKSESGSLQFVPADHQVESRFASSPETSWDALANDPELNGDGNDTGTRSVVTPSPPSTLKNSMKRSFLSKSRQRQQQRAEGNNSAVVASSSVDDTSRSTGGGSKMSRLASMFSSRAVPVSTQASTPKGQQPVPSSPPRSEASSCVRWPGTQDKQGVTVVAEPSYEEYVESDVGADDHYDQDKIHRLDQTQSMQASKHRENEDSKSDLSTSYSKTSSAYFNPREVQAIRKGSSEQFFGSASQNKSRQAAATVMRRCLSSSQVKKNQELSPHTLTEERLALQNRFTAPNRNFSNGAAAGYRGLLDRTRDVPNLIDENCSECTSAITAATDFQSKGIEHPTNSNLDAPKQENNHVSTIHEVDENEGLLGATSRANMENLNLALLGGGLTTIQTTTGDFTNRKTASDFDENLSNSDCDQYGFVKIPAFHEMIAAGMSYHDRSLTSQSLKFSHENSFQPRTKEQDNLFDFASGKFRDFDSPDTDRTRDLGQYYIYPETMQILVKRFRKISEARCRHLDSEDLEREQDAIKAFALSEMRSRIMEKDMERGLERKGGTTSVDDIVMTSYNKTALRVRDAVIVAKAWRDGATPQDIVFTANLTRRNERSFYIPRFKVSSRGKRMYSWEEVKWVDDNDLSQYRCHSLGPRHLKGTEMFTIGDCQSILLKLSNGRCLELRAELNRATANLIKAEYIMKQEGETFDGKMTKAEMIYLASMEEVKSISHKLVLAEKSFGIVKNGIEKLIAKYEALLVHFENDSESVAPSSIFSYESSCYSEDYSYAAAQQREDEVLARRAQRAELRAELVAREFLLSKQKIGSIRREKEKEIKNLKVRIADLQSETSTAITDRDRSVVLARAITHSNQHNGVSNRSKIDDIKQRFRNRSAAKSQNQNPSKQRFAETSKRSAGNSFHRTVGEEMFQHLDFYERSLKAVRGIS